MFRNKKIFSWCLYDWANSAYATVVLSAFLPIYYSKVVATTLTPNQATIYWSYTITIALVCIAIISPVVGAITDNINKKKLLFKSFVVTGAAFTSLLCLMDSGDWFLASVIFIISNIGYALAEIVYNSFLKFIATGKEANYVSSLGFSMGYLSGGILLAIAVFVFLRIAGFSLAAKYSFISVSVWWFVFSIPLFKNIHEPEVKPLKGDDNYIISSFKSLYKTFKDIKKFRQLSVFLIAFWVYNDGIGTIIKLAAIYGTELGIGPSDLIGALLATQIVGVPFTLLFSRIANRTSAKTAIMIGLFIYFLISVGAFFISTATHFMILAIMVGIVQGGTQALSRSMYSSMVPEKKSAEFFGFYGMSSRFAGIFGPLFFALIAQVTGSSRIGILSLIVFFITGIIILLFVDEKEGVRVANEY